MLKIRTCLNSESKLYGIPFYGVICFICGFCIGSILFSMMIGFAFSGLGLFLGIKLSHMIHIGKYQKFLYSYSPLKPIKVRKCPDPYKIYWL